MKKLLPIELVISRGNCFNSFSNAYKDVLKQIELIQLINRNHDFYFTNIRRHKYRVVKLSQHIRQVINSKFVIANHH
jgi:hypothetical protein